MKKLMFFLSAVGLSVILSAGISFSQDNQNKYSKENFNIEGVFVCDWNGNYYVRQIGNEILWYGEESSLDPTWSNVAHGTINGNVINLIWADVPKGSIMQHGKLTINIISNDNFVLTSQEGDNFGSSNWNRKTN
ncbi:MAG: hypothetical protein IPL53_06815 [Ignavibacteria bacterium]|nr:hypothetical protein [Ignavibacteria bacterium]